MERKYPDHEHEAKRERRTNLREGSRCVEGRGREEINTHAGKERKNIIKSVIQNEGENDQPGGRKRAERSTKRQEKRNGVGGGGGKKKTI